MCTLCMKNLKVETSTCTCLNIQLPPIFTDQSLLQAHRNCRTHCFPEMKRTREQTEKDVVYLLKQGSSDAKIAKKLSVSMSLVAEMRGMSISYQKTGQPHRPTKMTLHGQRNLVRTVTSPHAVAAANYLENKLQITVNSQTTRVTLQKVGLRDENHRIIRKVLEDDLRSTADVKECIESKIV